VEFLRATCPVVHLRHIASNFRLMRVNQMCGGMAYLLVQGKSESCARIAK